MGITIRIDVDDSELVKLINAAKGPIKPKVVADGVDYGIYQEMGPADDNSTHRWAFTPFMAPAVERVRAGFAQAFKLAAAISTEKAQGVVDKSARDVARIAKGLVRKDTSALANSIHVVDAGTGAFSTEFESTRE